MESKTPDQKTLAEMVGIEWRYLANYETADIKFQLLLDQAFKKVNNLAHHLIQTFEPGETTPGQVHEIGRLLADEAPGKNKGKIVGNVLENRSIPVDFSP